MAKQQRTMRFEQRSQLAAIEQLQSRSDEELEAETKNKAAAQYLLGLRAAERMDAKKARVHFQRALAAARHPQERLQLRRGADMALAGAERRADDFKRAAEKLGMEAPKGHMRQLRLMGLIAPHKSAGMLARIRGVVLVVALVIAVLALGFGIAYGIGSAAGGISVDLAVFWGLVIVLVALGVAIFVGRRRMKRAQAQRAQQSAARSR
jgi:uncharacterized membrane protein